jgi:hypothetical protein
MVEALENSVAKIWCCLHRPHDAQMLGKDLARCIRKKCPQQVIVLVTGYQFTNGGKKENLADITIIKPFSLGMIRMRSNAPIKLINQETS